jgi:hypothetical protein
MSTIAFTFGNFNPPVKSNINVFNKLKEVAKQRGVEYHIILSSVCDSNTNPIEYYDKINFMKTMFPKTFDKYIPPDVYITSIIKACIYMYGKGYRNIIFVAEQNRKDRSEYVLKTYNNRKTKWGCYNFDKIDVVLSDVGEYSSKYILDCVKQNDYDGFKKALPDTYDGRVLYQRIRRGINLK